MGTSPAVRWLRLSTPNAGGPGPVPGQGARSCIPQQRVHVPQPNVHVLQLQDLTEDPVRHTGD